MMKNTKTILRCLFFAAVTVSLTATPALAAAQEAGGGGSASATSTDPAAAPATTPAAVVAEEAAAEEAVAATTELTQQQRAGTLSPNPMQLNDRSAFAGFRAYGDIQVAYQGVNVDGSDARFRRDFGLNDGVRVKNSRVTFVPDGDDPASWFDRIELQADNLGGSDKFQSWGVTASKAGSYRASVRDRRVNWFWATTGDLHAWDQTRHLTDADLAVNVTENLVVNGNFNSFRQTGSQVSTRRISREIFQFEEPLDQTGTNWGVGARWRIGRTLLFLNQEQRKFTNNSGFGNPIDTDGTVPGGAHLEGYQQSELREMNAPVTRAGLTSTVADGRVRIQADMLYSKQEMDFAWDRTYDAGAGNVTSAAAGDATRKVAHGNARVLWRTSDRVSLYAQYRRRSWDQDARNGLDAADPDTVLTDYKVTIDQLFGGAEWAVSRGVMLFGEYGTGTRKQRYAIDASGFDEKTEAKGGRFGGRFRAGARFDGSLSFELGDVDNAFTRVSPATANTVKAKLRYRPSARWTVAGSATVMRAENDCGLTIDGSCEFGSSGDFAGLGTAEFDTSNYGLTAHYTVDAGRWLYAGYTRLDYSSNVPIRYYNLARQEVLEVAEYDATSDVWTVGGEFLVADTLPLSLYGRLSMVSNGGSFPVTYNDIGVGARYVFTGGFFVDVSGRFGKYEDRSRLLSNVDDYTAQIFTVGAGYRF